MARGTATRRDPAHPETAPGGEIEAREGSRRATDLERYQPPQYGNIAAQHVVTPSLQGYPDTFRLAEEFTGLLDRRQGGERTLRPFRYLSDIHAWPALGSAAFTALGWGVATQGWHQWTGGAMLGCGFAALGFSALAHLAAVRTSSEADAQMTWGAAFLGAGAIAGGTACAAGPSWISLMTTLPEVVAAYVWWHRHRQQRAERQRADIIDYTDAANPGPVRLPPGGYPLPASRVPLPDIVSWEASRLHDAFEGLKIKGITIRSITAAGKDAHTAVIALPKGSLSPDWVISRHKELASNLDCRHVEIIHGESTNEVEVTWYDGGDKLADTILWPGPSTTSFEGPIPIGLFENLQIVEQSLLWNHTLVGGATDNGKSGVMNVILCSTLPHKDVVRIGIDCKDGAPELGPYRRVMYKLATNPADGMRVLKGIRAVIKARGEFIGIDGESFDDDDDEIAVPVRKWDTKYGPYLLVPIDELAELTSEFPGAAKLLKSIRQVGRYVGVHALDATQYPDRDVFGGTTAARQQYQVRIGMACAEAQAINLIFGVGAQGAGWRLEKLKHKGSFMIKSREHQHPRTARAYYITDQMIAEMVNRWAADCPDLDELSAAAFEEAYSDDLTDDGDPGGPAGGRKPGEAPAVTAGQPFRLHAVALARYPDGAAVEANWQKLWQSFAGRTSASVDELVDLRLENLTSRDSVRKALRAWVGAGYAWKSDDGRYYPVPSTERTGRLEA